jgi:hypothetical protein
MEVAPNNYEENTKPSGRGPDGRWVKGFAPNPMGRPKGKTMKEWAKEFLARMTDEERDAWMEGIPKEIVWKMAEGNARNETDVTSGGDKIVFLPPEVIERVDETTPKAE